MGLFDFDREQVINTLGSATNALKNVTKSATDTIKANKARKAAWAGRAAGSGFPVGTQIYVEDDDDGNKVLELEAPDGTISTISHDDIKSADLCAMGVVAMHKKGMLFGAGRELKPDEITANSDAFFKVHGAKYKVELIDGRNLMLTVPLGRTLYRIENVLF